MCDSYEIIKNKVRIVEKVVPGNVCEETVRSVEKENNFRQCNLNNNMQTKYRDSLEVKIKNKKLINKFWSYIKDYVPPVCDNQKLIGPDYNRVYLLKYFEGQFFKKHYDGNSSDKENNKSKITVMIYLNDMDISWGGATRFYSEPKRDISFVNSNKTTYDITPQIGNMVLFIHKILHEGMEIIEGNKYCLRFNILYDKNKNKIKDKINHNTFTTPSSNNLKYTPNQMIINSEVILLNDDPNNKKAKERWIDVKMRDHFFNIEKRLCGFIDNAEGRPPAYDEDFCPNCYEILPIKNTYKNCSGCLSPIK